jgi:hypothetical protein
MSENRRHPLSSPATLERRARRYCQACLEADARVLAARLLDAAMRRLAAGGKYPLQLQTNSVDGSPAVHDEVIRQLSKAKWRVRRDPVSNGLIVWFLEPVKS